MAGWGVRIDGLDNVGRSFTRLASDAPDMAKQSVKAGAARLGKGMEQRAPELSGEMKGTVGRSVVMEDDGPMSVRVGPKHGLARILEDGGEITPTRADMLVFVGRSRFVRARRVTMPAAPFVRPAVDEDRGAAQRAVQVSAARRLRSLARG